MTRTRFIGAVVALILGLTIFNTVATLIGKAENRHRQGETHALAEQGHAIALANCHNIGALARIERAFIDRQEAQTRALLASGVTFGIPADKLPALIQASRDSQAVFLQGLDELTATSCTARNPTTIPPVKLGKAKRKSRSGTRAHGATVLSGAGPRSGHGRATVGPRSLPEHASTTPRARATPPAQTPSNAPSPAPPSATTSAPPAPTPAPSSPPNLPPEQSVPQSCLGVGPLPPVCLRLPAG